MGVQPTASKTYELLNCPRPFSKDTPIEPREESEASRWGSAVHAALEEALSGEAVTSNYARTWGLSPELGVEITAQASAAAMLLHRWLAGENDWGVPFEIKGVERHLATRLYRKAGGRMHGKTREVDFESSEHRYDLASFELGGTYDVLAATADEKYTAVIDLKTGEEDWHGGSYAEPKTVHQLLTLAVMTGANIVGIIHAPRGEAPEIYAQEVTPEELQEHARNLRKSLRMVDTGYLRDGPWCKYCPARAGCPAKDADLLNRASALVKSVTAAPLAAPVELGEFHMMYQEMKRVMARVGEEMKARVLEGEYHVRPDGAPLEIRRYPRDNISLASIRRALPGAKGEKLIRDLRKKGCIETTQVEALVAGKAE